MFNNYNSATTSGDQLSAGQVGLSNVQVASPNMSTGGTDLSSMGVTDTGTVLDGNTGSSPAQSGSGFWSKDGGAGLILGGVQVLGNLWSSYQAHKMAKEQMAFAREQWNTNLANQTQTYNTALEDRIRGRYAEGVRSEAEVQGEIDRHSL